MTNLCITVFCSVKKKGYVLKKFSEGANNIRQKYIKSDRSIHAEEEAIRLLPPNNKKKNIKLKLLVIRTTKKGEIALSKPCQHCLNKMKNIKGYTITHVYYSIKDYIVIRKLKELIEDNNKHISRFYRNQGIC